MHEQQRRQPITLENHSNGGPNVVRVAFLCACVCVDVARELLTFTVSDYIRLGAGIRKSVACVVAVS